MKSQIRIKRTIIHDEQVLMNAFEENNETTIVLESKHSSDQIRLTLSTDEKEKLINLLKNK